MSNEKRIKDCQRTIEIIDTKIKNIRRELKFTKINKKTKEMLNIKLDAALNDLSKIRSLKRELEQ